MHCLFIILSIVDTFFSCLIAFNTAICCSDYVGVVHSVFVAVCSMAFIFYFCSFFIDIMIMCWDVCDRRAI